uniref:Uncharacterized protein n=1 Tax=Anopheles culicifacies TaxID=139723 RepID=A0A182MER3_9DIPT
MPTPLYLIHSPRSMRSDTEPNLPSTCDATHQVDEDLQQTQAFKNWLLSRLKLPTHGHVIQGAKVNQINAHDNNELQAILTQPAEAEVCLLSDSPYRILRGSQSRCCPVLCPSPKRSKPIA